MAYLAAIEEEQASGEVRAIYRAFREQHGGEPVPELLRVAANSPPLLASLWRLMRGVLLAGVLRRELKELIVFSVAVQRDCGYCQKLFARRLLDLGAPEETLRRLRARVDPMGMPAEDEAALQFAIRFATAPRALADADFERLRASGMGNGEIAEVVGAATLAAALTTLARGLGVQPDSYLRERAPDWI